MDHKVHIYQHQALFIFYSLILPTKIICLCDQGTMWWESVLLTMESTTFPSGKWTWILSAGTLYRCKASVLHQLLLRTDHSRQVPHGHQQQHQHHHLLLGRQAVQGGAPLDDLLQAVRGPASGRSNSNQSTFKIRH